MRLLQQTPRCVSSNLFLLTQKRLEKRQQFTTIDSRSRF